jgi:hypothetical protein
MTVRVASAFARVVNGWGRGAYTAPPTSWVLSRPVWEVNHV